MDNDNDHPQLSPPLHNSSSPRDKEPKEFNAFNKWREERIQRRLKGEYESYVMHLSELVIIYFLFDFFLFKSISFID